MHLTPRHILTLATMLVTVVVASVISLALEVPVIDVRFAGAQPAQNDVSAQQDGLLVIEVPAGSVNAAFLSAGQRLLQLGNLPVRQQWLIEEPDQLPDWQQYNALIDDFNILFEDAADGRIRARTADGTIELTVRARSLRDLAGMFWLQLFVGVLCFLIAAGVYAFRSSNPEARHFLLTGLGLLLAAPTAAVYSSRELIMSGDLLRLLSALNWFGTILFTVALLVLFLVYPRQLGKQAGAHLKLAATAYGLAAAVWLSLVIHVAPAPGFVYLMIMVCFPLTFVLAFLQWKKTANRPIDRAALKWYLLSIYLGTVLFAVLIIVPILLGGAPLASQGLMFTAFLIMFIGIAFGIMHYRLFDLDRWWLSALRWFFAGVLFVVIDVMLVWGLGIGQDLSFALALSLMAWGWFPVRQWLLQRLHREPDEQDLQRLIQQLFSAEAAAQLAEYWQEFLRKQWSVLELEVEPGALEKPSIDETGLGLRVPHLLSEQHLLLKQPHQGSRLFGRRDVAQAKAFYLLARRALQGLQERQQAMEERRRILDDLHDDLGSKLLSLVYEAHSPQASELARDALRDLREVVSQPRDGDGSLAEAVAGWYGEVQKRLDAADIRFQWRQEVKSQQQMPHYRLRHITRMLREALSNVIRHAGANEVEIVIRQHDDVLELCIEDDGKAGDPADWKPGRGLNTIRYRLEKLGGRCRWQTNAKGGCRLTMTIPVNETSSHVTI